MRRVAFLVALFSTSAGLSPTGEASEIDRSRAAVEVIGIVAALDGRGIAGARIVMSAPGEPDLFAQTNPFGHFRFPEQPVGATRTFTVTHKRFQLQDQTITISDPADLRFAPLPTRTGIVLDVDFGTSGKVTTDFGGVDRAHVILPQPGGAFAVVGTSNNRPAIARYLSNGRLDITYGIEGKVISQNLKMAIDLNLKPAAVQADSKIVVGGGNTKFDLVLERRNVDGSIDQGFGAGGVVTLDFAPGSADEVKAVAIQPDGKIVAVGRVNLGTTDTAIGVVRFHADGSLDTDFGENGRAVANTPNLDDPRAAVIQPDGKIVVCGILQNTRQLMVRFHPDGQLDATFGDHGIAIAPTLNLLGYDTAIQSDGKILGLGEGMVRYNTDGTMDEPFNGTTGAIGVQNIELQAVGVRDDGVILAAGRSFQLATTGGDFGLALLHPITAQLISRVETDILNQRFEDPKDIFIQDDGGILVAGYVVPGSSADFAIVRYVNF